MRIHVARVLGQDREELLLGFLEQAVLDEDLRLGEMLRDEIVVHLLLVIPLVVTRRIGAGRCLALEDGRLLLELQTLQRFLGLRCHRCIA